MTQENLRSDSSSKLPMKLLQQHCSEANDFVSRMAELPIIVAEINQNGGILSPQFVSLLKKILSFDEIFLTFPPEDDEETFRYWILSENNEPEEVLFPMKSQEDYQDFCKRYIYYNDLTAENAAHPYLQQKPHIWQKKTKGLLLIPLFFQNKWIATLHICSYEVQNYNDYSKLFSQVLAENLSPILAYQELQNRSEERLQLQEEQIQQLKNARANEQLNEDLIQTMRRIESENLIFLKEIYFIQKQLLHEEEKNVFLEEEIMQGWDEADKLYFDIDNDENFLDILLKLNKKRQVLLVHLLNNFKMLKEDLDSQTQKKTREFEMLINATSQLLPQARNIYHHLESLQDAALGNTSVRQRHFLRAAMRSNKYITDLLTNLAEYSRCLTGQLEVTPEPLNLSQIIDDVRVSYLGEFRQKGIRITIDETEDLPEIELDERLCHLIFSSLMEHTLDATPLNGRLHLQIRPKNDKDGIEIFLEHQSLPIEEDDYRTLFQPFQRPIFDELNVDTAPVLALALAKELISYLGGTIEVEAQEDGLRFVIFLPSTFSQRAPSLSEDSSSQLLSLSQPEEEILETDILSESFTELTSADELSPLTSTQKEDDETTANESLDDLLFDEPNLSSQEISSAPTPLHDAQEPKLELLKENDDEEALNIIAPQEVDAKEEKSLSVMPSLATPPAFHSLPSKESSEENSRKGNLQKILFFSEKLSSSQLPILHSLEQLGFHLIIADSSSPFDFQIKRNAPAAIAFLSAQGTNTRYQLFETLEENEEFQKLPLLEFIQYPEQELKVRLGWKNYLSLDLPSQKIIDWLKTLRMAPSQGAKDIIFIGDQKNGENMKQFFHFLCKEIADIRFTSNPAQGIQELYKYPPHLLVLELEEPIEHWPPLFAEMSRSARTQQVPILLLSTNPVSPKIYEALDSLHFVHLQTF